MKIVWVQGFQPLRSMARSEEGGAYIELLSIACMQLIKQQNTVQKEGVYHKILEKC